MNPAPNIPKRCRRVWRVLEAGGWVSYDSLMDITGRIADATRLRELRRMNPGLIEARDAKAATGSLYRQFRINPQFRGGATGPTLAGGAHTGQPGASPSDAFEQSCLDLLGDIRRPTGG